ncbi:MAG: hypothetical protein JWM68_3749 [Verrucomicrobiales bacterium]|nr:hypothetical protein [Verrucomicrobiales bacterium]
MASKSKTEKTAPTVNKEIVAALEHIFTVEAWEIPDAAVEGKFARKVDQLEAQVKSLTNLVVQLSNKIDGAPVAGQRVDVLAATKAPKGKKK